MNLLILLTLFSLCMLAIPFVLLRHLRKLEKEAIEAHRRDKARGFESRMLNLLDECFIPELKEDTP